MTELPIHDHVQLRDRELKATVEAQMLPEIRQHESAFWYLLLLVVITTLGDLRYLTVAEFRNEEE